MQNTMVRGGGMVSWGEKNKSLGKNEKGERKKEENYIKKGEKGFKNASFWLRLARRKLICRGKKLNLKRGEGGGLIRMHNIYPCINIEKVKILYLYLVLSDSVHKNIDTCRKFPMIFDNNNPTKYIYVSKARSSKIPDCFVKTGKDASIYGSGNLFIIYRGRRSPYCVKIFINSTRLSVQTVGPSRHH